jgi:hypothetical protein
MGGFHGLAGTQTYSPGHHLTSTDAHLDRISHHNRKGIDRKTQNIKQRDGYKRSGRVQVMLLRHKHEGRKCRQCDLKTYTRRVRTEILQSL